MNEKEAWLVIWEAYNTSRDQRTNRQNHVAQFGLCNAICYMNIDESIFRNIKKKIEVELERIHEEHHELEINEAYFCPYNIEGDAIRAEFCLKQAALLESNNEPS